ncbi:MAG TPA: Hin recombinase [Candidatus Nanopusillus sp.]|nr:Hin recombinase [Candidatus Nanopusillus sp.]
MIELKYSKILSWDEIQDILNMAKKDIVVVKLPRSILNHSKMKYKLKLLKNPFIFIEEDTCRRGRKRKINETQKRELLNIIKEGHSIRETAKMVGISKSTVYEYVKDDIISMKKEQLKELIYEFKELFIENDLYDIGSVRILFKEIEGALEVGDYEHVMKLFSELKEYFD